MAPAQDDDDPWRAVTRGTLESLNRPKAPATARPNHGLGDTAGLLLRPHSAVEVGETPAEATSEIADLLSRTLADEPGRVDLWLMRFEIYRSQGMKGEFLLRAGEAAAKPSLSRQLDWAAVRRMWDELAPGEALPGAPEPAPVARNAGAAPVAALRQRRFSDMASQVAEAPLARLAHDYASLRGAGGFYRDFSRATMRPLRRPTPLTECRLFARGGEPQSGIFLKREDLRSVPPEFENAVAQAWLGRMLGGSALVSGNDMDTHSIALASAAATQGLPCTIFLTPQDLDQNETLVAQLTRSGARLKPADAGADPRLSALKSWAQAGAGVHLALSLGTGPHPYPVMVSDFQSLLGRETDAQYRALGRGSAARICVASLNGPADAIGFMLPYLPHPAFRLVFVESEGASAPSGQASTRAYRSRSREHRWLRATGRLTYATVSDAEARATMARLGQAEDIEIGLEGARALAYAGALLASADGPTDICVLVA